MRRTVLGSLAAVVVAALLAGCTTTGSSRTDSSPSPSAAASGTAAATATVTFTPTSASPTQALATSAAPSTAIRTDPNAPAGQCAAAHLAVSVQDDPTGSGAGQRLSYVVFRNTGTATCVLRGAPGVSLVGSGNGSQIGAAAARETGGATVTIPPGAYALAALSYPAIDKHGGAYGDGKGHDPQCQAKAVDGYRVYPPHSFRAYFTRTSNLYGCSTQLQTLHAGTVEPASKYADFKPKF